MTRLGVRRRLLLVVLASVVVALCAVVAGFNVALRASLDRNARDLVRSRADAELATLRVEHRHIKIGEAPDDRSTDASVWVFQGTRALEQAPAVVPVERAVRLLLSRSRRFDEVASTDTLLYVTPIVAGGRRIGSIVAGVSLAPYEETRTTALVASIIFGGLVLLLVGPATWWLLGASLHPVVRMTRQAADWSEHDLDHRFALGQPHDELTELAATLDSMLDRLATSLRRERRFSAEISHELRTPLAGLLAETELALRRERQPAEYRQTLELIHESAHQLSRTVDALVAAARYESGGTGGTADALTVATATVATCAALADERRTRIEIAEPTRALRLGVDPDLAERILQPLVENACRYATTRVDVAIAKVDSTITYTITDDGPGVMAGEEQRIFDPGVRGSASSVNGAAGAGLGLSLARRLAHSVDGVIEADAAFNGGRFIVRLPAA